MINLAVINLKTLMRRIKKLILMLVMVAMVVKFVKLAYYGFLQFDGETFRKQSQVSMIQDNLRFSEVFEENELTSTSEFKKILVAELALFAGAEEEMMEQENQEEVTEFAPTEDSQVSQEGQVQTSQDATQTVSEPKPENENVQTSVVEANNKKDVYTDTYQGVAIKNESKYSLTQEMLTPDVKFSNTKEMVIYHTHTCESYTPTENAQYAPSGNYRTTDLNFSVARVGTELTNCLTEKGFQAIHDTTYHDYPAYTGSYTRALSTIQNALGKHQAVDCVFDIHRDALRKQ